MSSVSLPATVRQVQPVVRHGVALLATLACTLVVAGPAPAGGALLDTRYANAEASQINHRVLAEYPDLDHLYKYLHGNPELSMEEGHTAARLGHELEALGFEVTHNFGGFGVVGVLRNGPGPTVLVRTEMDALPIEEHTGLPYASTVRARDRHGDLMPVMHACGHDVHMATWVGTAHVLAEMKNQWQGTLVFIAQPAEEIGSGADMMLAAGLFRVFPHPDYCLALHCDPALAYGHVAYTDGLAMANVDTVDITVRGKGGHGATPQMTVDPVVLSARLVLDLQTLVSRENDPTDPLVITVGSIHGGTKSNIIPDEVKLQLTVRSTKDSCRKHALDGIARMAKADAVGAGAPEPVLRIHPGAFTPAVLNDRHLTETTAEVFKEVLGPEHVHERPALMFGEDFAVYGRAGVPIFLYFLGTQPPDAVAAAQRDGAPSLPSLHSDQFHPVPEPTIKTGVLTMSLAVLNLVGKGPLVADRSLPNPNGKRRAQDASAQAGTKRGTVMK